jgi:hypothetical protein
MANNRTTANTIRANINGQRKRATKAVCIYGIPAALVTTAFFPRGVLIWVIIWVACVLIAKFSGDRVEICGATGEERALNVLSGMPPEFTIYNQIKLPCRSARTGYREADYIVVGSNGVFIVENKDYRGRLVGDGFARKWIQHKVGRGGTPYSSEATNPVHQVQAYVRLLGDIFREQSIRAWITPIVSLSRNNSLDGIVSPKVQVVKGVDLCEVIKDHPGRLSEMARAKVIKVLEEMRERVEEVRPRPASD